MMKKFLAILLCFALLLSMTAVATEPAEGGSDNGGTIAVNNTDTTGGDTTGGDTTGGDTTGGDTTGGDTTGGDTTGGDTTGGDTTGGDTTGGEESPKEPETCPDCGKEPCECPEACETCGKDPCECPKACEICGKEPCECPKACETCGKDPCECPKACETCGKDPCECPKPCEECGQLACICCPDCGKAECVCCTCGAEGDAPHAADCPQFVGPLPEICEECGKFPCECPKPCEICGELECICCEDCGKHPCECEEESTFIRPVFFNRAADILTTIKNEAVAMFRMVKTMAVSPAAEGQYEDVKVSKTVAENGDGTYTLTMESYVEGSSETTQTVTKVPADIVLVLDESGSMDNCIICGKEKGTCPDGEYKEIYLAEMKPENAANYIYETSDGKRYPATYCNKEGCDMYGKWLQNSNNHKAGGAHTTGSERAPKTSASDSNGYQYYEKQHSYQQRYDSLRTAVSDFLESVYTDSAGDDKQIGTADDVTNRVAIVGFGTKAHLRSYVKNADANTGNLGSGWMGETTVNTALTKAEAEAGNYPEDYDGQEGYLYLDDWMNADGTLNEKRSRYLRLLRWANNSREQGYLANALEAATSKLDNGSTYTELGLDAARALFAFSEAPYKGTKYEYASPDKNGRNRVVILFTDGAPTHGGDYFSNANTAIEYANDLKNTYQATVYTVGIFSGADASDPDTLPTYYDYSGGKLYPDSTNATNSARGIKLANRFMHLVSSNYPNATAMEDGETGKVNKELEDDESYYLSAGDSDELSDVFGRIYDSISDSSVESKLDTTTVVQDIVSDSFALPDGAESVTAYTMTYDGDEDGVPQWKSADDEETFTPDVDGKTITVDGFDFSGNYVGMDSYTDANGKTTYTPHGKKLVIEAVIRPSEAFLGGEAVETNAAGSGIYVNGTLIKPFEPPKVNIDLTPIEPKTQSGKIYLSQQTEIPHITNIGYITDTHRVDGINNEFVEIIYTITDESGNSMSYTIPAGTAYDALNYHDPEAWDKSGGLSIHNVLTQDTEYTVNCQVRLPDESKHADSDPQTATIYVFKPEITFKDSAMEVGTEADYAANNYVNVVWTHESQDTTGMGAAPTLVYSYDPVAGKFRADTSVQVTATAQAQEADDEDFLHSVPANMIVNEYATFYRAACDYKDCTHTTQGVVSGTDENRVNFVVHILPFDLTITKNGTTARVDENQTYIFRVTGPNGFQMDVSVIGDDSVTIRDLPVADYTVEELVDWSWRYEVDGDEVRVVDLTDDWVIPEGTEGTVALTFKNDREHVYWMDANAYCLNLWNGTSIAQTKEPNKPDDEEQGSGSGTT